MVIGHGMIAKEFESYRNKEGFVIFASGVSDSTSNEDAAFEREKLIIETLAAYKDKLFVYFSTCGIYDASMQDSAYIQHKIKMEDLISTSGVPFIIFRLTNPVGKTGNTHTVVNYFIKHVIEQHEFELWKNASRNIMDIDHSFLICNEILQEKLFLNTVVNVANPDNYSVPYIVETIEKHFKLNGNIVLVDKGGGPVIDTTAIEQLFTKFNLIFDEHYLPDLLQKYFPEK